jgi:hypothetical protein
MNRQLSNAVVGDVFSFDPNLMDPYTFSTGYIIVDYIYPTSRVISDYNIDTGVSNGYNINTRMTALTDQNTTFIEHVGGPVAMAAARRRKSRKSKRKSRKSKRSKISRRRR